MTEKPGHLQEEGAHLLGVPSLAHTMIEYAYKVGCTTIYGANPEQIAARLCEICGLRKGWCADVLGIAPINVICPSLVWKDGKAKRKGGE